MQMNPAVMQQVMARIQALRGGGQGGWYGMAPRQAMPQPSMGRPQMPQGGPMQGRAGGQPPAPQGDGMISASVMPPQPPPGAGGLNGRVDAAQANGTMTQRPGFGAPQQGVAAINNAPAGGGIMGRPKYSW